MRQLYTPRAIGVEGQIHPARDHQLVIGGPTRGEIIVPEPLDEQGWGHHSPGSVAQPVVEILAVFAPPALPSRAQLGFLDRLGVSREDL